MSQQGRESAKGKMMAQEKGTQRATERKSDQGLDHGMFGKQDGQGARRGQGALKVVSGNSQRQKRHA